MVCFLILYNLSFWRILDKNVSSNKADFHCFLIQFIQQLNILYNLHSLQQ